MELTTRTEKIKPLDLIIGDTVIDDNGITRTIGKENIKQYQSSRTLTKIVLYPKVFMNEVIGYVRQR
jgi:hypothetical protein